MRMDPGQFDFTKRKWHWKHLPDDIANKLATSASADELICVKATDTRAVYRFENLYIKVCGSFEVKDLLFPSARAEFNAYSQLLKNNIPAVKHLGWGRAGHYTALVTEAWTPDAVDVLQHWYGMVYRLEDTGRFLLELSNFLNNIIESPLHHGDFHLGNVLYSPQEKSFALVDLHNVKVGKTLTAAEKAMLLQCLLELRASIRPQVMLELFLQLSGTTPRLAAEIIRKRLIKDAARLRHDWPRRSAQFLSGYAKFSDFVEFDGSVLLVKRDKLRRNLFDPAAARRGEYRTVRLSFKAALEQMLFSFYLSMLQVPHVPVIALAPNGTLYFPAAPELDIVPEEDCEWINSYNEYLLCMDLYLEDYNQWRRCTGSQLVLADFSSMLAAMPDRKPFQPENVDPRKWKVRKH